MTIQSKNVRLFAIVAFAIVIGVTSVFGQITETRYFYGSSLTQDSRLVYEKGLLTRSRLLLEETLRDYDYFPAYDKAQLLLALQSTTSKNFGSADEILLRFLAERPLSPLVPQAHALRGFIAFEQQKMNNAAERLTQSIDAGVQQFRVRNDSLYLHIAAVSTFWRGVAQAKLGLYDSASVSYKECYTQYPKNAIADDALFYDGLLQENSNEPVNALALFSKYRTDYSLRNNVVAASVREAQNRLKRRQSTLALVVLESAESARKNSINEESRELSGYEIQTNADNAGEEIVFLRGEAYNLLERYDDALLSYNQFLQDYPHSPVVHQARLGAGWAYLHRQNYDKAIELFTMVIDSVSDIVSPVRSAAQLYRTIAWKKNNKREEAYRELSTLSVQSGYPYLAQSLMELGQMYYEDGKYTEARRALERGERESSDGFISARIQLLLGNAYLEERLYAKAAQAFSSAEFLAKNSTLELMPLKNIVLAEARLKEGIALAQSGKHKDAISSLMAFRADHNSDSRQDEALFWLGECFYKSDMFSNADISYHDLIDNYPKSNRREESLYGLGWTHFRQQRFDASGKWFGQLVKEFPKTEFGAEALARKGDGHYVQRQFAAAAQAYEDASKRAPNGPEGRYAAYQFGHALRRSGQTDKAIEVFRNYVKKYPRSDKADYALFSVGLIRFQMQQYDVAINDFQKFIEAYPQSILLPRAQYHIGDCYYNQGNYATAILEYKKVVDQFPTSSYAGNAVIGIQYCYESMGKSDVADSVTAAFIQKNPLSGSSEEITRLRGYKFYSGKRFSDAVNEYENYLKTYPNAENAAEALFYLGKSYINSGNTMKAEQSMDNLVKKYPKNTFAHLGILELGLMRLRLNEATKADSLFSVVEKLYPDSISAAQAVFEKSSIAYTRGDTAAALRGFRKVASKFAATEFGDQSAYRVAMYWRIRGKFDSARVYFSQLALREENPYIAAESQYRIGELYLRERKHTEALAAFIVARDKFSSIEDWFTLSMLGLGECYEYLSQIDAAKDVYATLQELRKYDDYGKTAAARLRRLKKGNYPPPINLPQKDSPNKQEKGGISE
ncbi:MAG: tetratricopeptide repeat protein [Ignavibacteria bacterium]|nr:tetratricopeptide repeat protein [Ignavibacteria bacterium]